MHKKKIGFLISLALAVALLIGLTMSAAQAGELVYGKWLGGDSTCSHPEGAVSVEGTPRKLGNNVHEVQYVCHNTNPQTLTSCGAVMLKKEACTDNGSGYCSKCNAKLNCDHPHLKTSEITGGRIEYCPDCGYYAEITDSSGSSSSSCDHPGENLYYVDSSHDLHDVMCSRCGEQVKREPHSMNKEKVAPSTAYPYGGTRYTCPICMHDETIPFTPNLGGAGSVTLTGATGEGGKFVYTGEEVKPDVQVSVQVEGENGTETVGVKTSDYTVEYKNNVNIGTGEVIVIGDGVNVKGKLVKEFEIVACTHPEAWLSYAPNTPGTHWVSCTKCYEQLGYVNHEADEKATRIGPNAEYPYGATQFTCPKCGSERTQINVADLENASVGFVGGSNKFEYTGEEVKPEVKVFVGAENESGGMDTVRVKDDDFTVEYKSNIEIGKGLVIVIGDGVNTKGQTSKEFEITHKHALVYDTTHPNMHWQYCTVEGCTYRTESVPHAYGEVTVTAPATCTQDAVLQKKCICGRVDAESTAPKEGDPAEWFAHHLWNEQYAFDFWDHWQVCTRCGATTEKQAHELTNVKVLVKNSCIENGSITADCAVCGKKDMVFSSGLDADVEKFPILAQYKATGHDFSGPLKVCTGPASCTSEGQGTHAASCVRCGLPDSLNKAPHAWGGWDYVSQGSCKEPREDVVRTASCECGAKLTLTYPREHVWVDDKSQDVQATCLEAGKINGQRCTICGIFGNYDFVPALGHDIQIVEKVEPTCEKEGFEHRVCTRGDLDETVTLKTLSPDGQHHFEPVASQEPTCTKDGQANGEKCKYCPAERAGETGYGIIPALGHKVVSSTATHGRTRTAVSKDGRPIQMQVYVTTFSCARCGASLGGEVFTVGTSVGKMGGQYVIESGNVTITDTSNGVHVNGNMSADGGVYFNGVVQDAYDEMIETAKAKYTYKKTETKSFIIEFTDEFLAEIEDGEYELVIINGSEYWPMMVTVKDHKFTALRDVDVPEAEELSEEEFDALLSELSADGTEIISRFMLIQPSIQPENGGAPNGQGDIVVVKNDGDYAFEAPMNGDYTLVAGQDYALDGDKVILLSSYVSTLENGQEITFHYADFGMENAPAPHEPKLAIEK